MSGTTWKPDPEGMNNDRAAWAASAVRHFMCNTGTDWSDAVADLLDDLMHFCDRENDFDFDHELDRARMHYEAETSGTVTILVNALNTIASGNTEPDRMVEIAGDALESFCPERGRTKIDTAGIPFDDEAADAANRTAEPKPFQRREAKATIRAKLVELIQLAGEHGIDIQTLMHKTLARCDPEPP